MQKDDCALNGSISNRILYVGYILLRQDIYGIPKD